MKTGDRSGGRAIAAKIAMSGMALAGAIFMAEVAVRFLAPQPVYAFERGVFVASEDYGYTLAPGRSFRHEQPEYDYTIQANSWGFRGSEPATGAAQRVLVLGDSYGMGQGVEGEEVLSRVAQKSAAAYGLDVDIFNASVSGYSTVNYEAVLRHLATTYKPELVVVLFYWNDIGKAKSYRVVGGNLLKDDNVKFAGVRLWLNRHSHLFCGLKRVYYEHVKKQPLTRQHLRTHDDDALRMTEEQLSRMNRFSAQHGIRMEVVLLPLYGIQEGDAAFQEMKFKFINMLARDGIQHRDWETVLPSTGREELAYPLDLHWTAKGHAFFAEELRKIINERYASHPPSS